MDIKPSLALGLLASLSLFAPGLTGGFILAAHPAAAASYSSEEGADPNLERTGIIRSVDPARHTLVLDDGTRFVTWQAPEVDVDLSGLAPGTRINVYYVVHNGANVMTAYEFP
jgi:hypothetical protein